jgi:hypothetical protein
MISKLWKERRYFIGGSDARTVMGNDEAALLRLWRNISAKVEREDLPLGVATKDRNRRWHDAITGRMPIGWHVAAACYATAAILLGWWPWNFLLLLLLFPIRNKPVRFFAASHGRDQRIGAAEGILQAREWDT